MDRRTWLARGAGIAAVGGLLGSNLPAVAANAPASSAPATGLVVEAVQMPAWTSEAGVRKPLSPGDTVLTTQEVETAADAGIVMRLPEGSLVRLGEKSRLAIPQLESDSEVGFTKVRSKMQLFEGFFRFTTSTVAKVAGAREIDVTVRSATIGVRGTDFWSMTDAAHDAACLFEGQVDLATRDQGALTLDKPTAFWARFFEQPVRPVGNATPDELKKFLNSTELKPGHGVAIPGGRWRVVAAALPGNPAPLVARLREAGYPAQVRARQAGGKKLNEVRINGLATRADATAVLAKITAIEGVDGRVALAA